MAELVQGFALGVREVGYRGMVVSIAAPLAATGMHPLLLEPAEAAELGQALLDQAQEAIHASRASRR